MWKYGVEFKKWVAMQGTQAFNALEDFLITVLRQLLRSLVSLKSQYRSASVPDLAPVIIEEGLESYSERLELMLSRSKRVKEIAVSGPYGSGKSTFIKSFEASHPELRFVNVTLGNFQGEFDCSNEKDDSSTLNFDQPNRSLARLEKAVLKQLLYRHSDAQEFGSRFVRAPAQMPAKWRTIFLATIIFSWFAANTIIWLQGREKVLAWVSNNLDRLGEPLSLWPWAIGFLLAVPILLLHDLYRLARRLKVSRINPISGEFELQGDTQESVFNLYLEEILAYFARSKVDVVVFEDMDRFKGTAIFQSLKELNKVINDSDVVPQSVRFVYALKDDLFKGDQRAKFFDAIIPVVPVIAGSNAYPQFKKLLNEAGIPPPDNSDRWDKLVRVISVYVQDMRLLKNIVSEFLLYRDVLALDAEPEQELKLLAFMAYKNTHCDDFSKLQIGEGELAKFFQLKSEVVKNLHQSIGEKITLLRKSEEDSTREFFEHKQELSELLLFRLSSDYSLYPGLNEGHMPVSSIGGASLSRTNPIDSVEKLFQQVESLGTNSRPLQVTAQRVSNRINLNLADSVNRVMPDFKRRFERLNNREAEEKRARSQKISQLKRRQSELALFSLPQCLAEFPNQKWFDSLSEMPMLVNFLSESYLDEDFGFYLSAFVEGHLTKKDISMIMALFEMKEFEAGYRSSNYFDITDFMTLNSCKSPAAYNIGLLGYLAENRNQKHDALLESIVKNQFIEHEEGLSRLDDLSKTNTHFSSVLLWWPDVFQAFAKSNSLDERSSVELLYRISLVRDKTENDHSSIRELLNNFDDSLTVLADIEGGLKLLGALYDAGVQFSQAPNVPSLHEVTTAALAHRLLALNAQTMMATTGAVRGKTVAEKQLSFSQLPMEAEDFKIFVHDNPAAYVDLLIDGTITDCPAKEVEDLLSDRTSSALTDTQKTQLIDGVDFQIKDLRKQDLDVCMLEYLVQKYRISITWSNALTLIKCFNDDQQSEDEESKPYFETPEDTLNGFFGNQSALQELKKQINELPEDQTTVVLRFVEQIIKSSNDFFAYVSLLEHQYDDPDDIVSLKSDQLAILIEHQTLSASVEIFNELQNRDLDELAKELVERNEDSFFESGTWDSELQLSSSNLRNLLKNSCLSSDARSALLTEHQSDIIESISPDNWLELLLPKAEKPYLRGVSRINESTLDSDKAKQLGIQPPQPQLELVTVEQILEHEDITPDEKLRVLTGQLPYLGQNIWSLLGNWQPIPDSLRLDEDGKLGGRIEKHDMTLLFCAGLVYHGLISSCSVSEEWLRVNHKRIPPPEPEEPKVA